MELDDNLEDYFDLLRCPFCDDYAVMSGEMFEAGEIHFLVECSNCCAHTLSGATGQEAADNWNRRYPINNR